MAFTLALRDLIRKTWPLTFSITIWPLCMIQGYLILGCTEVPSDRRNSACYNRLTFGGIMQLSTAQLKLHNLAIELCAGHRRLEAEIVRLLLQIEKQKIFRVLGYSSLFNYAVKALDLSEATAYSFITVARKCGECPALFSSIESQHLSVSKASRIVSALSQENAAELEFAKTHSSRQIDLEVARSHPKKAKGRDRVKVLSGDEAELKCAIPCSALARLERVQSLLSSKLGRAASLGEALDLALGDCLEKRDPVAKAKRAQARQAKKASRSAQTEKPQENSAQTRSGRVPLTAHEKHAVFARDEGRCTFVDPKTGQRCNNNRWTHTHHKIPVSQGGTNDPENLTTLCAAHHDLVHQLSFPFDGQITWLRETQVRYGVEYAG